MGLNIELHIQRYKAHEVSKFAKKIQLISFNKILEDFEINLEDQGMPLTYY